MPPQAPCLDHLWSDFFRNVHEAIDRRSFTTWIDRLDFQEIGQRGVVADAPSLFVKSFIERRFLPELEAAARSCLGQNARVSIRCQDFTAGASSNPPCLSSDVRPEEVKPARTPGFTPETIETKQSDGERLVTRRPVRDGVPGLNSRYSFENFVVGPSNQLSHAACLQIVGSPARTYNPLFIHASSGMGKTHLLQATCRAASERHDGFRVIYISCEEFMNRFVDSLKTGSLVSFRQRLRHVDCLAIDDIQFLAGKKRLQEEFFHTFNALYDKQKQIILSSDSKPRDMIDFEDRLLTRFQWGLLTAIDPPNRETRLSIAERKALEHDRSFSPSVYGLVADLPCQSVREIEGAVVKLIATADVSGRDVDTLLAREVLADLVPPESRCQPLPLDIANAVASVFRLKLSDIKSSRRVRSVLIPRQMAMHLIKNLTSCSLKEIGGFFGGS